MWEDLKSYIQKSNLLNRIIIANLAVFIAVNLVMIVLRFSGVENHEQIVDWLSASSRFDVTLQKPWAIITYMFLHKDVWHIFFNMLILFYIGSIFCGLLGEKRLLPLYIISGWSGWFLYAITYSSFSIFPNEDVSILGASAAVMGVMVATATYFPNYKIRLVIFGSVPLKVIAGIYIVIDFVALRGNSNVGGHVSHLGGALFGFFYALQLKKGKDLGGFLYPVLQWFFSIFKSKSKIKVVHRRKKATYTKDSRKEKDSVENSGGAQQKIIDTILDKISQSGYDSLTKEEKEILFKASKD